MALAEKNQQRNSIVTVFIGDGTLGEGVIYEAFNMAGIWHLPLLIVVENNHIAQTTPSELTISGKIVDRFTAFAIPSEELDTSDVLEIKTAAERSIEAVRTLSAPRALILNTARFGPHSKGDDTRSEAEVRRLKENRDPVAILRAVIDPRQAELAESEVENEVQAAFQQALADPAADFEGVRS
jgi:TPP-dependent pyruvate/acetoin dehydrogenase alpha subunit